MRGWEAGDGGYLERGCFAGLRWTVEPIGRIGERREVRLRWEVCGGEGLC